MTPKIPYLALITMLLLQGCQTPVQLAGNEHRIAIEKWQELARYSESKLDAYPVTITAQLATSGQRGPNRYQLKNIMLSPSENSVNINLVQPVFTHKYICRPMCNQLLEYVPLSPESGATLLSLYFNQHEYELFEFYGLLYRLNDAIGVMEVIDAGHVDDYLNYVMKERHKVDDLKAFIHYLSARLSAESYEAFLSQPETDRKPFSHFKALAGEFDQVTVNETEHWNRQIGKGGKAPESDIWVASAKEESKRWRPILGEDNIKDGMPKATKALAVSPYSTDAWKQARKIPISLEGYVCSYQQNYFGWVAKISDTDVTVTLLGQAKLVRDGVIFDEQDGFLFSDAEAISFLPSKGNKIFKLSEVAACYPQ